MWIPTRTAGTTPPGHENTAIARCRLHAAGERVAGTPEHRDGAVPLSLFDRAVPTVLGDRLGDQLFELS